MMSDALDRLRHRQRPEVPVRDATLAPASSDAETSFARLSDSVSLDTLIPRYQETKKTGVQESNKAEALQTKQSTMRLEAELSDRLQEACRLNGLSREVLIEALFLHCEADLQAWQAVLQEAKHRAAHRQQIANLRRARSMMQKFDES